MYALSNPVIANAISGTITLGTPFIHSRPRDFGEFNWYAHGVPPFVLSAVGISWLLANYVSAFQGYSIVTIMLGGILGMLAAVAWIRLASVINSTLISNTPNPERLLIIRSAADEAGAALALLPLASAVLHVIARGLVPIYGFVGVTLKRIRRTKWGRLSIAPSVLAILLGLIFGLDSSAAEFAFMSIALLILLATTWLGGLILLTASTIPLVVLFALSVIAVVPFGLDLVPVSATSELSAEPAPSGSWRIHIADCSASEGTFGIARIMHSRPYSDDDTLNVIRLWIRSREQMGIL